MVRVGERVSPWSKKNIALVIILFGIILRLRQYIANRSLWLDEAMLALNIVSRSFVELTQPLSYNQGAPLGFLFVQKTVVQVFGNRDYILRLFPLMAGIAALLLFYEVANSYVNGAGVLVALGLFAVSSPLVYYASEVKQYSSDAMISLLLLLVACRGLEANVSARYFIVLSLAGAVSLWMSHPALFILVGIGLSLALDRLIKRDWPRLAWLGVAFLVWLASFAILYFVSLRSLTRNAALIGYWQGSFVPMPPWRDLMWFPTAFFTMFGSPIGAYSVSIGSFLLLIVFVIGCFSFLFGNWQKALILVIPFPATLLASGLEAYPFGERLLLFIVPLVFLLVAEGLRRVYLALRKLGPRAASSIYLALAFLLLVEPTGLALKNLWQPYMGEHIKPVISYVTQHKQSADFIYVYYGASSAFRYYAPQYGLGNEDYTAGVSSRDEPGQYNQDLDKLNSRGRVWFLFSHNCFWCPVNEEAYFLAQLDKRGTKIDEFVAPGASAYLYNLALARP